MKLELTNQELAFFSGIFNQAPPILLENYKETNPENQQRDTMAFMKKYTSMGIIVGADDNFTLIEEVQELLASMFAAEYVVTIFKSGVITKTFYFSEFGNSLVSIKDELFLLETMPSGGIRFEDIFEEQKTLGSSNLEMAFEIELSKQELVELEVEENDVELAEKIENIKMIDRSMKESNVTVLTERISKPGTIISQFVNNECIYYQSVLLSDDSDLLVFGAGDSTTALCTIMNFRGR